MDSLEAAPTQRLAGADGVVVRDGEALRDLCTPLGPRLGLLQVRSRREWERLAAAAPHIGPCPDLREGMVVGIACWAGTPINGAWPVELRSVKVHGGGGLLTAAFTGGSYLPDGTACLETVYVEGLRAVLVVDVDGTTFYPHLASR